MGLRCEEKGLCYKLLYTDLNVKLDGNAVYVCTTHSLQNFRRTNLCILQFLSVAHEMRVQALSICTRNSKSINFVDRMVDIFINNLEVLNSSPNYACNL